MKKSNYKYLLESMTKKYKELSGCNPEEASDIGIRLKVLAKELELVWNSLDEYEKQAFPSTAEGKYLDMHCNARGINRKQGSTSVGKITFYRQNEAISTIFIPKGTVVATQGSSGMRFRTTSNGEIPIGEREVTVLACCEEIGRKGNVGRMAIDVLVTPVSGISGVCNREMFTSGTESENDQQLRERLYEDYRKINNGTNEFFYYHKAMEYDGITSANVIPRVNGIGTVEVVVDSVNTNVSEDLLETIKQDMNFAKEINVDVTVTQAQKRCVDFEIEVSSKDGFTFEQSRQACMDSLDKYFSILGVAEPMFLAKVIGCIVSREEIANCSIKSPIQDIRPTSRQILRLGSVLVTEMAVI